MRVAIAEKMADALAMPLQLETASVRGQVSMFVNLSEEFTIPVTLRVWTHFDAGVGKDAGLLLEGPGDLLVFVGYSEKTKDLCVALIDRSAMNRKPKEVMQGTSFVDIAVRRFNDGNAVRGLWSHAKRKAEWKEM